MAEMRTFRSGTYKQWYGALTDKDKRVVDARVDTARNFGVLNKYMLLLTGGNKNSQPQDITDSKKLIARAVTSIKMKPEGEDDE